MEQLDITKVADEVKERIREKAKFYMDEVGVKPKLAIIRVGTDWASVHYETSLLKKCDMYGLDARVFTCLHSTPFETFKRHWKKVNEDSSIDGILLLQPLPESYDIEYLMDTIDQRKDIDCFGTQNKALLYSGRNNIAPCTSQAVIEVMKYYNYLENKNQKICLIGRSEIVGKPLAQLLLNENMTFSINHSKTPKELLLHNTSEADIIISCTGAGHLINNGNQFKEGVTILDVGMKETDDGKLIGDFNPDVGLAVSGLYTPVRGGIGAITSLCLLERVCDSAISLIPKEKQEKIKRVYATNKNGDELLAFDMPFCNEVEK